MMVLSVYGFRAIRARMSSVTCRINTQRTRNPGGSSICVARVDPKSTISSGRPMEFTFSQVQWIILLGSMIHGMVTSRDVSSFADYQASAFATLESIVITCREWHGILWESILLRRVVTGRYIYGPSKIATDSLRFHSTIDRLGSNFPHDAFQEVQLREKSQPYPRLHGRINHTRQSLLLQHLLPQEHLRPSLFQ